MLNLRRVALALLGLALLAATISTIIQGTLHPSTIGSVGILVATAIVAPLALGTLLKAWKMGHIPSAEVLKTEVEAKNRLLAALTDAETAETIKKELQAYISLRALYLERERRKAELLEAAYMIVEFEEKLNELETKLNLESSKINPETVKVVEKILKEPKPIFSDYMVPILPFHSILQPIIAWMEVSLLKLLQERRLRRQAALAPEAIPHHTETSREP